MWRRLALILGICLLTVGCIAWAASEGEVDIYLPLSMHEPDANPPPSATPSASATASRIPATATRTATATRRVFASPTATAPPSPTSTSTITPTTTDDLDWLQEFERLDALYRTAYQKPSPPGFLPPTIGSWGDGAGALPAYIDMYEWSGDTEYLDRFVDRMETLIPARWDANGDGLAGWPTAEFSVNVVKNGNFESDGGPANWGPFASAPHPTNDNRIVWYPSSNEACTPLLPGTSGGERYATLVADSTLSQTLEPIAPFERYLLQFYFSVPAGLTLEFTLVQGDRVLVEDSYDSNGTAGPTGWRLKESDLSITQTTPLSLTFTLEGTSEEAVRIDNVSLNPYVEEFSSNLVMAAALGRFATTVHTDGLESYTDDATAYQEVAEELILETQPLWRELDEERAVYVAQEGAVRGVGQTLPHNILALAGMAHAYLDMLPTNSSGLDHERQAEMLARTIKGSFYANPERADAIIWNYRDWFLPQDSLARRVEDVEHARTVVEFVALMQQQDRVFDDTDIQGILTSLTEVAWDGNTENPAITFTIDGVGSLITLDRDTPYRRHLPLAPDARLREVTAAAYLAARPGQLCSVPVIPLYLRSHFSVPSQLLLTAP